MDGGTQNSVAISPMQVHGTSRMRSRTPVVLGPLDIFALTTTTKMQSSKTARRSRNN